MNITAGKYKGQKIIAPDENITRPTLSKVRMSVFNTLQSIVNFENSSFLDMFSGSGIMGLEALSRGFSDITFIEKNKKVVSVLKANLQKYKAQNIKLVFGDCLKVCRNLEKKYDVIYIDPPYFSGIYEQSIDVASKICNGVLILEHVIELDLSAYNLIKQKKYGDKYISLITTF